MLRLIGLDFPPSPIRDSPSARAHLTGRRGLYSSQSSTVADMCTFSARVLAKVGEVPRSCCRQFQKIQWGLSSDLNLDRRRSSPRVYRVVHSRCIHTDTKD